MISTNQKLRQLDHEMENKKDVEKEMLVALESLFDRELLVIGIENQVTQMRNVHKVLKRAALIE